MLCCQQLKQSIYSSFRSSQGDQVFVPDAKQHGNLGTTAYHGSNGHVVAILLANNSSVSERTKHD